MIASLRNLRAGVLHNVDYLHYPPGSASYESDADVKLTAEAVTRALAAHGVEAVILTVDDQLAPLAAQLREQKIELVFNLVESLGGDASREPEVPEFLESLGVAYTGNRAPVLRAAQAKDEARRILSAAGVAVPGGIRVERGAAIEELARELERQRISFPLFVKPARTDASIGIDQASLVNDRAALARKLESLAAAGVPAPYLIEEYLPGREINVAIFPEPVAGHFVCTDIDFSKCVGIAPIVTYDCKWRPGTPDYNAVSKPSRGRIPEEEIAAAQKIARDAFLALGGTSYGRVDLRGGRDGRFYVIDVNPNNDISPEAGLAIAARSVGVEHDVLIKMVVEAALARKIRGES